MDSDDRRVVMKKLRIEVHSSEDEQEVVAVSEGHPHALEWSHHPVAAAAGNNRSLLLKQLSMKETTREVKWEKRRRQILRRSSMVALKDGQPGGEVKSPVERARPARSESARCLTDEDLDELRGSFELGFGFDEDNGGADLCDTLPALDLYFAVNRQLSDPKLRTLVASPTSILSATSSSSTLSSASSPRSLQGQTASADAWKIFTPGDNPQLIKTRLRHWAQVVACSVKHGCGG